MCRASSCASSAKRCGAPTRKAPKSPALWESGIVVDGDVPHWPRNGRTRVTSPTMSCGANVRIGFCVELSGNAAAVAASRANSEARASSTVTPSRRASSNAIV